MEWISIKDKLPKRGTKCVIIIKNPDGFTFMETAEYIDEYWYTVHERITHWMPLPEPPSVG